MALNPESISGEIHLKTRSLEQQYIDLLEQRVNQLQRQVRASSNVKGTKTSSRALFDNQSDDDGTIASPTLSLKSTKENGEPVADEITQINPLSSGFKSKVRHVVNSYNEKTGRREDIPIDNEEIEDGATEPECYLRNIMDPSDPSKLWRNEIDLSPGALLSLLRETMEDDPTVKTWVGQHVILEEPFPRLVYSWDKLVDATDTNVERPEDTVARGQARVDLKKVLKYVQSSKDLESYFKNRKSNLTSKVITYDYMWTIFPRGIEVIATTFMDERQILRVGSVWTDDDPKSISLYCWYYDHDGSHWIPAEVCFEIEKFPGTKSIETLPCYPLQYYRDTETQAGLKSELIERGKEFERYCKTKPGTHQRFDYRGRVISSERGFSRQHSSQRSDERSSIYPSYDSPRSISKGYKKASADGRIIVDPSAYLDRSPTGLGLGERDVELEDVPHDDLEQEQMYLIAPPRILGWSTRSKSWCQFSIRGISSAKSANATVFEKELQLDPSYKAMIKALVRNHKNGENTSEVKNPDLIEGKGRSLVILLHGPPGVGKTLTAEAISAESGRPLLTVSVAEIGLNATKAEQNLERIFELASRWEAILLVDEADVFLESRIREADTNRNALVSILLRVLEYYHGIMILTTNRIKSIDVAVQSRIHLAVRYDDLTRDQMRSILGTILTKFNVEEREKQCIVDSFKEHAEDTGLKLNGRQIRNLVFSAQAMASADGRESISWSDIKCVTKVTREFQTQLKSIVETERAYREVSKEGD